MKHSILFLISALGLCGQATHVQVTSTEATRVVMQWDRPTLSACSLEVSESASYTPLVHDVNTTLFTGSDSDLRSGNPTQNGRHSVFLIGTPGYAIASDGKTYSRALAALTLHFYRLTCNSSAVTGTFVTANVTLGNSYPRGVDYLAGVFGNLAAPTLNLSDLTQIYVDATTGVKLIRIENPGQNLAIEPTNNAFFDPVDLAGAWTNPTNIIGTGGYADVTSTGVANAILLGAYFGDFANVSGFGRASIVYDWQVRVTAYGDNTGSVLSACMVADGTHACIGNTIDLPTLTASPAVVEYPPSVSYPTGFFTEWLNAGVTPPSSALVLSRRYGTQTCSGTAMTWTGGYHSTALNTQGDYFNDLVAGQRVIDGGGVARIIASVTDSKHLTTTTNCTTGDFSISPFGMKIWKKSGTGAVHLKTAIYGEVRDEISTMPDTGQQPLCSQTLVAGGFACVINGRENDVIYNRIFHINRTSGVSRLISRAKCVAPCTNSANASDNGATGGAVMRAIVPDPADPTVWWALLPTGSNTYWAVFKMTYSGDWSAYAGPADNQTVDNPDMAYLNVTKASDSLDLFTQARAVSGNALLTKANFPTCNWYEVAGHYGVIACSHAQDDLGFYMLFNTQTHLVEQVKDTWSTFPNRFNSVHNPPPVHSPDWAQFSQNPLNGWSINITAVTGNSAGDTSLGINQVSDCAALGVVEPWATRFGATGSNCVGVTMDAGDVRNCSPETWILNAWPHPNQGTYPGCAQLNTLAEGDQVGDALYTGTTTEHMVVVARTGNSFVLRRGYQVYSGATARQSHADDWANFIIDGYYAGAVAKWWQFSTGTVFSDNPSINGGHFDLLMNGLTSTGSYVQTDGQVRNGLFTAQIGQLANWTNARQYQPIFGGEPTTGLTYLGVQGHTSCQNQLAVGTERNWCADGHPWGPALGGSNSLWYHQITDCGILNNCTGSNAATAGVYKVGLPTDSGGVAQVNVNIKTNPLFVWAGRTVLKDKSGPSAVLGAADTWNFCYAYNAGECQTGSSAGDMFMNVPQMYASAMSPSRTLCQMAMDINAPCWTAGLGTPPWMRQIGISHTDPTGTFWRGVSTYNNGHGWADNFMQPRSLPDGSAMYATWIWANGVRTIMMLAFLPVWPVEDSTNRTIFAPAQITLTGRTGDSVRLQYGYTEYDQGQLPGDVPNCVSRNEACFTNDAGGTDFAGETPHYTTCGTSCNLILPIVPHKVIVYRVVRKNGPTISTGPIQVR